MSDPDASGHIETYVEAGMELVAEVTGLAAVAAPEGVPTFVLVHGIGMGRRVFGELVDRLAPHGTVIAVDLPGYGEADEPEPIPTIEQMADLLAGYLRARRPHDRAILVGHSMGTQVVTEVAVRHPTLVDRIVLVAPTVDRHARGAVRQLVRLGIDLIGESPKVLVLGAREYLRAGPHLRRKMHAMLAHRPEDAYPRVQAPALVIRGERDRVSPPRWCAEVADALRAWTFVVDGHGHETLIRSADPAAGEILRFAAG